MSDVCLIYLPKPYLNQPDAQAPLGLMYIAASIEQHSLYKCEIMNFSTYTDDQAIEELPAARLYGITVTSLEVLHANRFAKRIKKKYGDVKIILGGPGVYAKEFIDFSVIDSIMYGDGEHKIFDVLMDYPDLKKEYKGFVYNLDSLPFPARHKLKSQGGNIFAYNKKYADGESTIITTSRGCPMKCAFCSAPSLTNKQLRFRSIENVIKEIKEVKEKYNIRQFRFSDDFFTVYEERVLEFCKQIKRLNVFWRVSTRVKPLSEYMLKAMKDAGCTELSFGIESFDDDVLKGLKKGCTARDNIEALELADKVGIDTRILMMIRTPFQNEKTIKLNKTYLTNVPHTIAACTAFIPIPGCDIWNNPEKYNIEILDKDLDKYNFYMFGPDGRRPLDKIFRIKDRCINEFHQESEQFRDWLENDYKKINRG